MYTFFSLKKVSKRCPMVLIKKSSFFILLIILDKWKKFEDLEKYLKIEIRLLVQ